MHSSTTRILADRFAPSVGFSFRAGRSAAALLLVTLALPLSSFAQDNRVTIIGTLFDGTPPPAAPKPEAPADFEIRETVQRTVADRKITLHRVKNPGLPNPTRLPEAKSVLTPADASPYAFANPVVSTEQEQEMDYGMLMLSATVVDHRATLLAWNHEGRDYRAWSNLDFNDLSGFFEFQKGRRRVWLHMSLGDVRASATADASLRIPFDLPFGEPAFRLIQGDPLDTRACEGIAALHELYRTDGPRLRQARILREQRALEQAAWLRAHPPVAENVVLHYWKVQPVRAEGGAK